MRLPAISLWHALDVVCGVLTPPLLSSARAAHAHTHSQSLTPIPPSRTAPVFADPPPAGAPPGFAAAATHPLASFLATPPIPADLLPYLAPPAGGEGARVGGRRRKQ